MRVDISLYDIPEALKPFFVYVENVGKGDKVKDPKDHTCSIDKQNQSDIVMFVPAPHKQTAKDLLTRLIPEASDPENVDKILSASVSNHVSETSRFIVDSFISQGATFNIADLDDDGKLIPVYTNFQVTEMIVLAHEQPHLESFYYSIKETEKECLEILKLVVFELTPHQKKIPLDLEAPFHYMALLKINNTDHQG
ncbi:hypothetical protein DFA_09532 [Cavenderia fasciculata]|uniref:Uncharacterized protein n=1 Tax=Cavenderia fasciculata TaxID=261658 RepID=F4Q7W3_CACFS|nr:uncharacterized protein DFA_09532 [Cavenderia fasciculata]EGG15863.1 hypothetical protein DFA_09532 [Cavenderia fasciculata]|eukprot:XP_004352188.1 hypothetical protein DFA_09532 [Cavenderia fasciculata]